MKRFEAFGIASSNYNNAQDAANATYTDNNGKLPPTPLIFSDNPFNHEITKAKNIFEIGTGVGRNIPWIMQNTDADYFGVEPNDSMREHIWKFNNPVYNNRVHIAKDFNNPAITILANNKAIDVVISTFVFQHIGYMTPPDVDNVSDITTKIRNLTHKGTVWILLEHDSEDDWIHKWFLEQQIKPEKYIRGFIGIPELTCRDRCAPNGGHHLIIWKES